MFSSSQMPGTAAGLLSALATKAKAFAAGVSEIELKVLEATNEDKWGPHGNDMKEIARAAEDPSNRALIMEVIGQRLREHDDNWRLCYKALLLCEHLIRHGPMRCVDELQRSAYIFERLRDNFQYKDMDGRDQGINVRQRARELAALLSSNTRIQEERDKARINANKYTGVSAADMRAGGGGSYGGFSGSSGGNYVSRSGASVGGGGYSQYNNNNNHNDNHSSHSAGDGYGYGGSSSAGHSRSTSSVPAGTSNLRPQSDGRAAGDEDPFEATRKRIERLRAQEVAETSATGGTGGAADQHIPLGSINMDASTNLFPESKPRMGPKRLSEVKVNPAMAAAFGSAAGLAPPPPARNSVSRTTPASAMGTPTGSTLDLLNGLSASPPPPTQQTTSIDWDALSFPSESSQSASQPPVQQPQQLQQRQPELDLFATAPAAPVVPAPVATTAAAPLDFLAFDSPIASRSAPTQALAPAAGNGNGVSSSFADPFGDPFGLGGSGNAPAVVAQPQPQAPMADPFSAMPAPAPTLATAPSFSDPFGSFPAPTPASVPVSGGGMRLTPMTAAAPKPIAKKTDPFADLLG